MFTASGCLWQDEAFTYENRGTICVIRPGERPPDWSNLFPQTFERGAPLQVVFFYETCLSTCHRDLTARCTLSVDGGTPTITTSAHWVDTTATSRGCGASCTRPFAECTTGEVATSDAYQWRYGNETLELAVPSEHARAPCVTE